MKSTSVAKRLEKCLALMESEISVLQVEKRIRTRVKRQMEKTQREYYLNEQMKAIQKELGDEDGKDDLSELEEKIKTTKLSKEAHDKALAELKSCARCRPCRLKRRSCAIISTGWFHPWKQEVQDQEGPECRAELLDAEHFGLDKVKERIVEYLAVQSAPTS